MTDVTKKASAFLHHHQQNLSNLFSKINFLKELNDRVLPLLDVGLKKFCQVANVRDNRLIFLVANGSAATQLRFQTPELLNKFKLDVFLKNIQSIECKVRPFAVASTSSSLSINPLSNESAESIRRIAEIIEDPQLKKALMRLASHTQLHHQNNLSFD